MLSTLQTAPRSSVQHGLWGPEDRSHFETSIPNLVEIESIEARPNLAT